MDPALSSIDSELAATRSKLAAQGVDADLLNSLWQAAALPPTTSSADWPEYNHVEEVGLSLTWHLLACHPTLAPPVEQSCLQTFPQFASHVLRIAFQVHYEPLPDADDLGFDLTTPGVDSMHTLPEYDGLEPLLGLQPTSEPL